MTPLPTTHRSSPALLGALLATLALTAATLAGCSSGSNPSSTTSTVGDAAGGSSTADGPRARTPEAGSADGVAANGVVDSSATRATQEAVISHGRVVLRSLDVADARLDVLRVVHRRHGEVTGDRTDTDDRGRPVQAQLVLRIPSAGFAAAMDDLRDVAELAYASSDSRDVTTKVIDTRARLRAQRRSVHRVEQLLARAQDLRDIVLIESELSRRQAALESLEHQAAYLAGQTRMSTITVEIERKHRAVVPRHEDHTGFLAGLSAGWHGLTTLTVGLATAVGAVLPFAVVLALLAAAGWPVVRTLRRRHAATGT